MKIPIYNGSLETVIWSIFLKIFWGFLGFKETVHLFKLTVYSLLIGISITFQRQRTVAGEKDDFSFRIRSQRLSLNSKTNTYQSTPNRLKQFTLKLPK